LIVKGIVSTYSFHYQKDEHVNENESHFSIGKYFHLRK
jgi:hypothetical protein